MKSKFYILAFLIIISSCNSDQNKIDNLLSKYEQYQLDTRLSVWMNELETIGYELCKRNNCVSESRQKAIFEYERRWKTDSLNSKAYEKGFNDFYTYDFKKWNPSEIFSLRNPQPGRLIEFVIESENYLSIGYTHGGIVTTPFSQTYRFENGIVKNHWIIYREVLLNTRQSEVAVLSDQLLKPELEILK